MAVSEEVVENKQVYGGWFIRLVKGIIIGIGAIVPGLSGGVLAVVFGLYNPLMHFLANLHVNFIRNLLFFLPVFFGVLGGIFAFSAFVDFAFENYAAEFTWLFVGFIAGTFPSLVRTAGEKGRKAHHWVMLAVTTAATLAFMEWLQRVNTIQLEPSFFNWLLSGVLVGLGVVVPGMSPSNFLIYLGLYQPMAHGISHLDFSVLVPLTIGTLVCVFAFARVISWLFKRSYAAVFHLILGVVIGSTLAIAPIRIGGVTIAVSALLFLLGAACSYALAKLDEKHPHESFIEA